MLRWTFAERCEGGAGLAEIVALKADLTSRFRGHNVVFFDSATHPLGDATFRVP